MSALRLPASRHPCGSCLRDRVAAVIALSALLCCANASAGTLSPLPASDYKISPACGAPAPGHAGCLALRLLPVTVAARAHTHPLGLTAATQIKPFSAAEGSFGLRPQDLRTAYFPNEQPVTPASEPQTIALVDAYDDPDAASDLETYSREFGLPVLPKCAKGDVSDCFEKVNQLGETGNLPVTSRTEKQEAEEWALETSTDIEVAHGVCQNCRIVLVETDSAGYRDLEAGEEAAVKIGAQEISNSWGGESTEDSAAFDHPGIVITAAAGDDGYLNWTEASQPSKASGYFAGTDYPASSPQVVAVGGTKLTLGAAGVKSETVWNDGEAGGAGGGGCATGAAFAAPPWQSAVSDWSAVGCGSERAVADVSADADPDTGVAVYDSVPYPVENDPGATKVIGWTPIGGTSVASPIIASMFALAGGSHGVEYPAETLYSHLGSSLLSDVTEGGNGECQDEYSNCSGSLASPFDCGQGELICNAAVGYDGPTGVGSPNTIAAMKPSSQQIEGETKEKEKEKEKTPEQEGKKEEQEKLEEKIRQAEEKLKRLNEGSGPESKAVAVEPQRTDTTEAVSSAGPGKTTAVSTVKSPAKPQAPTSIRISSLTLSSSAIYALNHGLARPSALAFSFTINASAPISLELSRQIRTGGHMHWRAISRTRTIHATKGTDHRHLGSQLKLTAGRYLLTLTPAHGAARSIAFREY
jgi:hypothetical protein